MKLNPMKILREGKLEFGLWGAVATAVIGTVLSIAVAVALTRP